MSAGPAFAPLDAPTIQTIKHAAGIAGVPPLPGAMAQPLTSQATKPGKERWPVKTGTDPNVNQVNMKGVVPTTVQEMISIPRPSDMQPPTLEFSAFQNDRSEPVETTIWQLEATITMLKLEADGDYHLVLQGESGDTMIGEVPTPRPPFVAKNSPFLPGITAARKAVETAFSKQVEQMTFALVGKTHLPVTQAAAPPGAALKKLTLKTPGENEPPQETFKMKTEPKKARLTGVGFFDRVHGQSGVSLSNGIELHPLLAVEFL